MDQIVKYGLDKDLIFLALFAIACGGLAWLVRWVLVTSGDREARLIGVTETLAGKLGIVEDIKVSVGRLENRVDMIFDGRKG